MAGGHVLEIGGVDCHFVDEGPRQATAGAARPALLFAHCLGGDLSVWQEQAAHFSGKLRCVRYDLRGQGRSGFAETPRVAAYDMAELAKDALALLDALHIERAVFCGVSMGGMVALEAALAAPGRFAGLVLADTAAGFPPEGRAVWDERIAAVEAAGLAPLVDTMMARWLTEGFRVRHPERVEPLKQTMRGASAPGYLAACRAIRDFDVRDRLAEIGYPTLVVCGENDPSTPLSLSRVLAGGIAGADLHVVPDANHLPNYEFPERFNDLVTGFLATVK